MSWYSRLKNAISSDKLDDELAEEMRDHLDRRAKTLEGRGFSPEDAQHQAALRFGNVTRLREESRDFRLWTALDQSLSDLRYALRTMRKSPAFAATAIASLAIAIGAHTAIYSIVDAAILRPLPLSQPEQLVTLAAPEIGETAGSEVQERTSFSYPLLQKFKAAAGPSARLALFSSISRAEVQVQPGAPLERAEMQYVSADAFDIAGVTPAIGALASSATLSYEYWQRRFAGDPAILGRALQIDGRTFRITGVARSGFFGIEPGKFVDVWLPATAYDHPEALSQPGWHWFRIFGRLSSATSREQLQARLQPVFHDYQKERVEGFPTMPETIRKQFVESKLRVHPGAAGASNFRTTFQRPLWIVLGVAAGILLIACANVASLLLARSTARAGEMAMRISLGAARSRLVRQLLTESLLLSTLAGAMGWLLARSAAPAIVNALSRQSDPVRLALAMDTRVLLFSLAISTLAAVCFGLLPAWQASATKPNSTLRGRLRTGRVFVAIQVAFAFCLVMTGAAFLLTLYRLHESDPGFDPRRVAVIQMMGRPSEELRRWILLQTHAQGVAAAQGPIFSNSGWSEQILVPGKAPSDREEIFLPVSPGYFDALKTPLRLGRDLNAADRAGVSPVPVIVNRAFARRYFGGDALGREFARPEGTPHVRHVVVGVAADAFYTSIRRGAEPIVYLPLGDVSAFTLYVRTELPLGDLVKLVDRAARAITPGARVHEITTLDALISASFRREKLLAGVGGIFALLGMILAAIGLFGLLNYAVIRRTREIGIRAALGARPIEVVWLILRDLLATVSGGLACGLALSIAVLTTLRSLLFEVKPIDPLVICLAAAVFLAAASAAGGWPARKAASIDPMLALRHE